MTFRFNFETTLQAAGVLLSSDGEVQKLNAKGNVCRQATGSLAPESKRSLMKRSLSRRPWWRRARLSIRGLMVLVLVIGAGLGWFIRRAAVQRDAAKAIVAAGGSVRYDFQNVGFPRPGGTCPGPKWLVGLIGVDFFADVISVSMPQPQSDAILAHVGRLRRLERLDARTTRVTDAGLAQLRGLSELRSLSCSGTPALTDAGLAHLSGLGRLESLSIEGPTRIEGPGLAHLASLNRLRGLLIHIESEAGLPSLSRLVGLRKLSIDMPNVTDTALAQLVLDVARGPGVRRRDRERRRDGTLQIAGEPRHPAGVWAVVHRRRAGRGVGDGPALDLFPV